MIDQSLGKTSTVIHAMISCLECNFLYIGEIVIFIQTVHRNCEILKRVDLMPETLKKAKKREMNRCTHFLKKWKAFNATCVLESFTKTFMDTINTVERKTIILSEKQKLNEIAAESDLMSKIIEKALLHNKENLLTLRNNFSKEEIEKKNQTNDFYLSVKKGSLNFERINELLKKSEEGEKEIKQLLQMKKQFRDLQFKQ